MSPKSIALCVGLGNPGSQYINTRHNAGFWWTLAFAQYHQSTFRSEKKFLGECAEATIETNRLRLLMPQTFMNHSGQSVRAYMDFYRIEANSILVVHDELDLPAGDCRLKWSGGHAGHNGIRDIIQHLGTPDFWRLRIGIGRPPVPGPSPADFVLAPTSAMDRKQIMQSIDETFCIVPLLCQGEIERAQTRLHTKTII